MAFTISFNEFVLAFFLTGGGFQTLPIYIYSMIRWESSPIINAAATVMLVFAGVLVLLMYWVEGARALTLPGTPWSGSPQLPEDEVGPSNGEESCLMTRSDPSRSATGHETVRHRHRCP